MKPEQQMTLQETRSQEMRACPQCGLGMDNPFVERCPRCFSLLPKLNLYCNGCLHSTVCPVKNLKPEEISK